MRPAYFAELLAHVVAVEKPDGIAQVESFAQVGAVGTAWPPCGLKISGTDGQAVFLSFARTSALVDDGADNKLTFDPGDLTHVPALQDSNVG